MNKEQLQQRITKIHNELAICKAQQSKLEGHLSEAIHWLAQLEKAELPLAEEHNPEIHGEGMPLLR